MRSDEPDRAHRLDGVAREVARAVRELCHDMTSSLSAPVGVLELLRDHPGLGDDERRLIDMASAQLAVLEAQIGALRAQVLRLDPAREPPHGPDHPRPTD